MDLILYGNAKRAVAQLQEFDEVVDLGNKAKQMAEYARRAKDKELEIMASEYRVYCQHRAGEYSKQLPTKQGHRSDMTSPGTRAKLKGETLDAAGLSRGEAARLEAFSEIPIDQIEEAVKALKSEGKPPTKNRVIDIHFSSTSAEHYTPDHIIEVVMKTMGDIDLDPCADPERNIPAFAHFTEKDNGLLCQWHGRIYMNPPYGTEIGKWAHKLLNEYKEKNTQEAIALVPSRTDTQWFDLLSEHPVCFVRGRLKFKGNRDSAPFPSAIFYLGNRAPRFIKYFSEIGRIWERLA